MPSRFKIGANLLDIVLYTQYTFIYPCSITDFTENISQKAKRDLRKQLMCCHR